MGTNLFAVCCTAHIPAYRINSLLRQTYQNSSKLDCQPSLFLIQSMESWNGNFRSEATQPPIEAFESPFIGKSIADTADMLGKAVKQLPPGIIDPTLFAILDQESSSSESGLVVQVKDGFVDSVRVHFDTINAELIRTQIITFDIAETKGLVGDDGVFRTKPPDESRRGKPAPRKKLG